MEYVIRWLRARVTIVAVAMLCLTTAASQELKVASIAPDGSSWMRAMRDGAEQIRTATDGRVIIKFYPGGVMGDDAQILRRIRIGQLHGGAFTASGLAARYPALNLYGIPLLFRSLDEVDHVREALDTELINGLEHEGFVSFGFIGGGFAQLMSNTPTRSVDDMRRRKVWIPAGDDVSMLALQAVGISPVALPVTDVLTGLQTGLLDVVASSPVVALVLQWHTKVKYVTDLPIAYSMGIFAIEANAFARLSAPDQAVVRSVMSDVVKGLDTASRDDNQRALKAMYDTGIEAVTVDTSNLESWRLAIEDIYPALRGRADMDSVLLDRLLAILRDFRAGSGTMAAH
jgi:TRAP-type C4-dicarboxylate transport system substrate-binding protein